MIVPISTALLQILNFCAGSSIVYRPRVSEALLSSSLLMYIFADEIPEDGIESIEAASYLDAVMVSQCSKSTKANNKSPVRI